MAFSQVQAGHSVDVLSFDDVSGGGFFELPEGVPWIRLDAEWMFRSGTKPPWRWRTILTGSMRRLGLMRSYTFNALGWHLTGRPIVKRVEEYLNYRKPDVVVTFKIEPLEILVSARPRYHVQRIAWMHGNPEKELRYCEPTLFGYRGVLRDRALKTFDLICVLLDRYKPLYPPEIQARIRVIPNIVRHPRYRFPWHQRPPLVIAAGSFAPVKRFDLLIEAWAQVASVCPEWKLEIWGDGALRDHYDSLIEACGVRSSVSLPGRGSDIDQIFGRAQLLVHPASYEGFGLVIAEALARGVPVMGFSDCSGVNHLIQDGLNGVLVVPGANVVKSLSSAMIQALTHREVLKSLSQNTVQSVAEYTAEASVARWQRAFQELGLPETTKAREFS